MTIFCVVNISKDFFQLDKMSHDKTAVANSLYNVSGIFGKTLNLKQ